MLTDLDHEALWHYRGDFTEPADFDAFWQTTLDAAREHDLAVRLRPVQAHLRTVEVHDVTFAGFGGHPIRGWLRVPRHRQGRLPAIVQFHGYGSGRGTPVEELVWSAAGYAHLVVDTRGQGGAHAGGATGDPVGTSWPSHPGFLTRGIEDEHTYFYRRVFTDAVRAVDAVRGLDVVDPARVAVVGNSQGGGIALAVAGLVPDVAALYAQAPFFADVRRALRVTGTQPYAELIGYLAAQRRHADRVFRTLGYFDGLAFAARATAPAWFSCGLRDDVVPPSTTFAAYHAYRGPKQIQAWEHNGHEAGGAEDTALVLAAFGSLLLHDTFALEEQR
ncbi:cephalosporin-C deacetylase [Crossiella equi]|uniref:Cephalosporin-C deacetylase n=1 Tax=Crossiella equi TaxID=130796 RepID=A0ABS5A5Y0_9PSEU|nr:alpha/beta fold hydrolase [Crossiella equi]MBP2472009.1 cephalosporin-C deacetylase [Crossiella equi]